ncbi:MAG: MFS transporter [Gammaproteobacteria bacterium]|nr:MFS transporter [Gammaproteobacteria bacterium]
MTDSNVASKRFDELDVSAFHWRIIFTAGMGFFTDAYDLFVIGVVTTILMPLWHFSTYQIAWLDSASLAAAALGAIFFGTMADKFGRKRLYGVEVIILFIGTILSALAPNFICLLMARVIVGLGIGGDYPTSAVVASENANRSRRGFIVLLVFAMQALGLIVGPLLASFLLAMHIPHHLVWRLLLGLGAIPAASVFYLRRKIHESPRYLRMKKAPYEVSRVVHDLAGQEEPQPAFKPQRLLSKRWLKTLVATAGAWFLLDVAFYGNSVSSSKIMQLVDPHSDLLIHILLSALIFTVFAVPGYFLAAKYVDKVGRKPLQYLGFAVMAIAYGLIGLVPGITGLLPVFLLLFGISYFFTNFGPNSTTFLVPSEVYPTSIRAKAHGISAAIGKVGAFLGVLALPIMLHKMGLSFTMLMMSVVAILGCLITYLLPEMKQVSLDEVEISEGL